MIIRPKSYLNEDGMPSAKMVLSVLKEHLANSERLHMLGDYYRGRTAIMTRTRSEGLPNNRMAHAYPRYIVSVTSGYLVGQPVAYSTSEDSPTLDAIRDIFKRGAVASVDTENARNAAIYGRGIEYLHSDEDNLPHVSALDPKDAFVVYDDSYDVTPLFGIYFIRKVDEEGAPDGYRVWVMTDRQIVEYACDSLTDGDLSVVESSEHFFGGVPLIEYWNDENEMGDFEWVIPQIDGYDKLESDRLNDKEQCVDSMLLLVGCTLETDERGRPPWKQLREDKALCLPDNQAHAEYLRNAMDETGNQILRNSIVEDIHKLSMVPDLSDENFASNASGVAMRYKLWGLEQLTNIKEQWFVEGLRSRLKLLINFLTLRGGEALDVADVKIEFSRALPTNIAEIASIISTVSGAGAMSTQTKVQTLHSADEWTDDDVADEVARIKAEQMTENPMMQVGNMLLGDTVEQLAQQDAQDQINGI